MTFQSVNETECAASREHYAFGYLERLAELSPWMRVDQAWESATKAAAEMFPLPPSPEERALFAQLDDIEVN